MNVGYSCSIVLRERMATLRELQEYYSYSDVLNMEEVITVSKYNEWVTYESGSKRK